MIVDIHGHIGQLDGRESPAVDLARYREAARIDRVLVSNLDGASVDGAADLDEQDANLATLAVHQEQRFCVPLYWTRPRRLDSNLHAFAGALESEPFVGAVFAPHLNDFPADDAEVDRYLTVLSDLKRAAVFWTGTDDRARPRRVYAIAQRHPSVPCVLYNATGDTHWREALDCAERARQRRDARLYLEAGRTDREDVAEAIAMAGEDHVMFGSEAVGDREKHAEQVVSRLARLEELLSARQFAKLIGLNAEQVFHLDGGKSARG